MTFLGTNGVLVSISNESLYCHCSYTRLALSKLFNWDCYSIETRSLSIHVHSVDVIHDSKSILRPYSQLLRGLGSTWRAVVMGDLQLVLFYTPPSYEWPVNIVFIRWR
jgi:hypothetical protein